MKSLFPETDAGIKILWGKLSRSGMTRELELADSAPLAVNKRGYCGDTSLSVRILPVDSLETRWRLAASRFRSSTLINCPLRVLRSSTSPSSVNSGKCFLSPLFAVRISASTTIVNCSTLIDYNTSRILLIIVSPNQAPRLYPCEYLG